LGRPQAQDAAFEEWDSFSNDLRWSKLWRERLLTVGGQSVVFLLFKGGIGTHKRDYPRQKAKGGMQKAIVNFFVR
jgi:hypothetical protein